MMNVEENISPSLHRALLAFRAGQFCTTNSQTSSGGQCQPSSLRPGYWIATDYSLGRDQTRAPFYLHIFLLMHIKFCLPVVALSEQVADSYFHTWWLFTVHRSISPFSLQFLNLSSPTKGVFKHLSHEDGWLTYKVLSLAHGQLASKMWMTTGMMTIIAIGFQRKEYKSKGFKVGTLAQWL